jgi:hypothetical protein
VLGIDETIERRRGEKMAAQGIDRDPVRSSHAHVVNVRGWRGVSLRRLAPRPWTRRVWGCRVSRCCRPRSVMIRPADVPTALCWTAPGKPCGWCDAGCRSASWAWWVSTPMRRLRGSMRSVTPCVDHMKTRTHHGGGVTHQVRIVPPLPLHRPTS